MKRDIAKRWVDALRSGKFQQTRGRLHRLEPAAVDPQEYPVGFCCLGVLCELAVADGVVQTRPDGGDAWYGRVLFDGSACGLPIEVRGWAGITGNGQYWNSEDDKGDLIVHNDDDRLDFGAIADIIEANVDSL